MEVLLPRVAAKNKNKEKAGGSNNNKSLAGAPTAATTAAAACGGRGLHGNKRPQQPFNVTRVIHCAHCTTPDATMWRSPSKSQEGCGAVHEQQKEQSRHDGSPPHQWEGKQQVIQEGDNKKDEEMSFQKAKRVLKAIYGYSNSDSSIGEHHKKLHVMYGGPWDITSRYLIRTLSQAVAAAAPAPRVVSYHK
jgi:hypothetical protein